MSEEKFEVIGKRTEELSCELGDAEVAERADLLASTRKRQRKIEATKQRANAEFNASLKECNETIDNLAETIKTRKETRPVQCEERAWPELGRAELIRLDTGASLRVRSLTPKELEKFLGTPGATEVKGDGKPGEVVDLKVHQGGKGKGKRKKKGAADEDESTGSPEGASPTTSPAAAGDSSSAAAPAFEKCPHPECTAAVDHDGPHVVAEPASSEPPPPVTDDLL